MKCTDTNHQARPAYLATLSLIHPTRGESWDLIASHRQSIRTHSLYTSTKWRCRVSSLLRMGRYSIPSLGSADAHARFSASDRGASPSSVNTTLLQQLTRLFRLRHSFSQPLFSFVWPRMDSSCRAAFMSELHDERSDASVLVVYLYFCFLLFPPPPLPASSLGLRGWRAQPLDLEMAVSDPVSWSRALATQSGRVNEGYSRTRFLRISLCLVSSVHIYLAFSAFRLVFPSSLLCRHEVGLSPCR